MKTKNNLLKIIGVCSVAYLPASFLAAKAYNDCQLMIDKNKAAIEHIKSETIDYSIHLPATDYIKKELTSLEERNNDLEKAVNQIKPFSYPWKKLYDLGKRRHY